MGPMILLDKSAIQSLSREEIIFLFKHYYVNIPPILIIEILADLKKQNDNALSETQVSVLANKLLTLDSKVNVYYKDLCLSSLLGHKVEMNGQIIIHDGQNLKTKDGICFKFIDEQVERTALRNWQMMNFCETDQILAQRWREITGSIDLNSRKALLGKCFGDFKKIGDINRLSEQLDNMLSNTESDFHHICLRYFVNELHLPDKYSTEIFNRWVNCGLRPFKEFAPYAYFCFRANILFYWGLLNDIVSTRSTNLIDLEYLYYLPFCWVFTSGDKFHKIMVPPLLRHDQIFVDNSVLKEDLKNISEFWSNLNPEAKEQYQREFGCYPPENLDSITHQLWLKHMKPRSNRSRNIDLTPEQEQKFFEHLKPFFDAIDDEIS